MPGLDNPLGQHDTVSFRGHSLCSSRNEYVIKRALSHASCHRVIEFSTNTGWQRVSERQRYDIPIRVPALIEAL